MRKKLTLNELKKALEIQLEFIKNSCELFDQGCHHEALRIAVAINLILIDTDKQKSILHKILNEKMHAIKMHSTNISNMNDVHFFILLANGVGDDVAPFLNENDKSCTNPGMMIIDEWLNQKVISLVKEDRTRYPITRKEIIRTARDKDGGAHIDDTINNESYLLLKEGIPILKDEQGRIITTGKLHLASMRQLGYEVLNSNLLSQI